MKIEGARAVVTGGASGIGRAIAAQLAARECRLMIADVDAAAAEQTASSLGANVRFTVCNVRNGAEIESLAEVAWRELGGVDLVFANAGAGPGAPLLEATAEAFDIIYETNVRGSLLTCTNFARRMIDEGRSGHLCVTGSEHSIGMQHTMMGQYTASKHAVLGWADVLRYELPEQVGISVLLPGIVATRFYDATRNTELPPPEPDMQAFGEALMRKGMPAEEVAGICLRGVEDGAFLIPTHACSRAAMTQRCEELGAAFDRYAPAGSGSEKYEVNALIHETLAQMGGGD